MFKLFVIIAAVAVCVYAKPGVLPAAVAYSAPLVAAAPAAVVTAHSSQVVARNYNTLATPIVAAAYTAPVAYSAPVAYKAPAVAYTAPLAYSAPLAYKAPLAPLAYKAPLAPLAYSAPLAYRAPVAPVAYSAYPAFL